MIVWHMMVQQKHDHDNHDDHHQRGDMQPVSLRQVGVDPSLLSATEPPHLQSALSSYHHIIIVIITIININFIIMLMIIILDIMLIIISIFIITGPRISGF